MFLCSIIIIIIETEQWNRIPVPCRDSNELISIIEKRNGFQNGDLKANKDSAKKIG